MSKYNVGDTVVIRKDLVVGEVYGDCYWDHTDDFMKNRDYVVIEEIDYDGSYWIEDFDTFISEEMIEGLYG